AFPAGPADSALDSFNSGVRGAAPLVGIMGAAGVPIGPRLFCRRELVAGKHGRLLAGGSSPTEYCRVVDFGMLCAIAGGRSCLLAWSARFSGVGVGLGLGDTQRSNPDMASDVNTAHHGRGQILLIRLRSVGTLESTSNVSGTGEVPEA